MTRAFLGDLAERLESLKAHGLFKEEQVITSPQQGEVTLQSGVACINLCANNYLGLSNHPRLIEAATDALKEYGFGMSSVRFICGTQLPHKRLEGRLSAFLGMEDTILFPSCFDANAGLFETLLGPEDAVVSDALNHASIIDGVRLCKAKRYRDANRDMADLEARLDEARGARYRLVATDGVFSMDRLHRRSAGDLRPGRTIRRNGDGRRQPRRGFRGRERARHARALRRRGARGHSDRDARQGAGRGGRRLCRGAKGDRWNGCASGRARTCSPTPSPPSSPRPA